MPETFEFLIQQPGAAPVPCDLPLGSYLPAERALANALGISRGTVTAAYAHVRDAGLIDSRQGSGSQISQPTYPLTAGGQDTRRIRRVAPPPLPLQRSPSPSTTASVLIALAIAIPISMLVGSLLTFLLLATLG